MSCAFDGLSSSTLTFVTNLGLSMELVLGAGAGKGAAVLVTVVEAADDDNCLIKLLNFPSQSLFNPIAYYQQRERERESR